MKNEFMQKALELAKQTETDIPVGAVVVKNGEIIASAFNTKENDNNITSHAEILALCRASKILNNWRLDGCDIYVTLEPCPMCAWAIMQSRIKNIYFGSYDIKYGAFSKIKLEQYSDYKPAIYGGICEPECDEILNEFFKRIRA